MTKPLAALLAAAMLAMPPAPAHASVGVASRYARSLAGRRTANGERYSLSRSTVASRSLPLCSLVKVELLAVKKHGRWVRVHGRRGRRPQATARVNDRGPYVGGRMLDCSEALARGLGFSGLARVRVTRIGVRHATHCYHSRRTRGRR